MKRNAKVVRMSRYRKRKNWPVIIAAMALVTGLGIILGIYIYDEYHTYGRSEVRDYETVTVEQGDYLLKTEKKELLGKVYVGFSVADRRSGEEIYRCPDLYLVTDFSSADWSGDLDEIVITLKDGNTVHYVKDGAVWENSVR